MQMEFSTSSYPGQIPQEGAGRLINAVVEKMGDGVKWVRSPGVQRFFTTPPVDEVAGFRGAAFLNNRLWVAYTNALYQTNTQQLGLLTVVPDTPNTLAGSDPVFFAANLKSPTPDVVATQANGGAYIITPTTITQYPVDASHNLPVANTVDVTYLLGFFFFAVNDGRVFASDVNDTTVPALNVATAQGKADVLFRVVSFGQQLYMCGRDHIEVWGTPINATAFPLNRITVIPRGIIGPRAVTCFENGFDLGLVFCSGNNQIMRLNGYQPERISEPDLERRIALITDNSTIELTSFNVGGHMYLKVRSPLWCWIYDFSTQTWHERVSYESLTSRLGQAVFAFGNVWIVGDHNSSDLGLVTGQAFDEFNSPLPWWIDSKPVGAFPSRVTVGPAHFNFAPGTGNTNMPIAPIAGIAQASSSAPLIITSGALHNFNLGDTVYINGVIGLNSTTAPVTSMINGRQFLVANPITPASFAITDLNGGALDSTVWSPYVSGGSARKQNLPSQQTRPLVSIAWSNDDGVNFGPPRILELGAQSKGDQLIRTFLTGSIGPPYGRIWRIIVTDPVYVSFKGGEMPRIGKRSAA